MLAVIDQVLDALAQVNAIGTRLLLESLCACHGGACTHVHARMNMSSPAPNSFVSCTLIMPRCSDNLPTFSVFVILKKK